ncbi:hypothetical protein [Sphingobium subterraneum]|uniref:Uncharacterized protein n=1 Tax=Sphingobium subterraneum TaxID=627688 RepID=A0A841IX91_9SPHN|nr:hypothetical protein [Sphingobium subterraneum]MBB6123247.1 hypothetical protein [Sphingobium subterraneum]
MTDTPHTDPAAEPTAEELAAASYIRPLEELPSNWTVKGDPKILTPSISALSPDDQKVVMERAGSADPEAVHAALITVLREKSVDARLLCGAGEGTTALERTALEQMSNLRQLAKEADRIDAELADVVEHRTEYVDGRPVAVPVYRYNRDARTAREARLDEIRHNMVLIAGIEGQKDLDDAARADVRHARNVRQQLAEREEAKALGEKILRDERIKAQAETYAKHHRQTIN